jgi:hypothetical protein
LEVARFGRHRTVFQNIKDSLWSWLIGGDADFSSGYLSSGIRKAVVEVHRVFAGFEVGREGDT